MNQINVSYSPQEAQTVITTIDVALKHLGLEAHRVMPLYGVVVDKIIAAAKAMEEQVAAAAAEPQPVQGPVAEAKETDASDYVA